MNQRTVSSYHSGIVENGHIVPRFQNYFFQYMRGAEYDDIERGERGISGEHLTVTQFKIARPAQIQAAAALAQAVKEQKKAAQGQAGNVVPIIGPEQVDRVLAAARQQEQAEKERR